LPETFKPIPVRSPVDSKYLFFGRCLVDLQLLTIFRFLRSHLPGCKGRLLDVGAGEAPWRYMLSPDAVHVGADVELADDFGMKRSPGIVYYDGIRMPFDDSSFHHVLCTEVLEHAPNSMALLKDMHRVLVAEGQLILTVPWSARVHHIPHDYVRFTSFGLVNLLREAGFSVEILEERGNDVAVIANKIIVLLARMLKPGNPLMVIWTWPLAVFVGIVAAFFLLGAHISLFFGIGSRLDPLGYAVIARKRSARP
jgi:SAM-dependent methyltransferase